MDKSAARLNAKLKRLNCYDASASFELIRHFPALKFRGNTVAGYWPLKEEINVRPLLNALDEAGQKVALPCVVGKDTPLIFRRWKPGDPMTLGLHSIREPQKSHPQVIPNLILVPLLAFTSDGKRLGYGGGYYDRTLQALRRKGEVFACGVAYAGQEVSFLPTDQYDQKLDGTLTEKGFIEY